MSALNIIFTANVASKGLHRLVKQSPSLLLQICFLGVGRVLQVTSPLYLEPMG